MIVPQRIKRKGKRTALTLLAVTLASVSLLAACGKSQEATGSNSNAPAASKKIHVLTTHAGAKYAQQAKDDDIYVKEMSKLSGYDLKFEFLGHGDTYTQQMTVRFASGDLPDLIRTWNIDDSVHPGAVDQGIFHELGPLIDKYGPNLKKKIPPEAWSSPKISKNGKIYAIPAINSVPSKQTVFIRKDWLDKLGMKPPSTIDDYLKFFEAVKKEDMNGNGDPNDEYGFYVRENLDYSLLFFKEFNAYPSEFRMVNGEFIPGIIAPEMKDALKFWKMLYDNKYINPNLFTNKGDDWVAGIKQGKGGVWTYDVTNYSQTFGKEMFVNQPTADIAMIDVPVGPKGTGLVPIGDPVYYAWVIPTKVKNPEEIVKFLDWVWTDEAEKFFSLGIKGHNYTEEGGKVKWDVNAPANKENDAYIMYQLSINPRGDGRLYPAVIAANPNAEVLQKGLQAAAKGAFKHEGLFMPALESLKGKPELAASVRTGSLFSGLFAKVITGKEPDVDAAFDKFVAEWKRRGGDAVIKEATDWYNSKNKK